MTSVKFSNDFIIKLKKYLELQNALDKQNEISNKIRKEKTALEESLLDFLHKNKLDSNAINLGHSKVIPKKTINLPPLSVDFLRKTLKETLGNDTTVNTLINKIEQARERQKKIKLALKIQKIKPKRK